MVEISKGGKKLFDAENAFGFIRKVIGLMNRSKLNKNEAMLFSFPFEYRWSFWMLGMRFPLDIVFIDKNRKVVHIEKDAKPLSSDPKTWKMIKPAEKCKYVIEINAGESSRKRIKAGDVLNFYE